MLQGMCRWTAVHGLTVLLRDCEEAGKAIRMCCALPLLPANRIVEAFDGIQEHTSDFEWHAQVQPFYSYVQRTWILGKVYGSS